MRIRGKKGFEPLVGVIIASIFVAVIGGVALIMGEVLTSSSDYIVCESSYKLNYAISALSRNNMKPAFTLACYTQNIKITSKGIYRESLRTSEIEEVVFTEDDFRIPRQMWRAVGTFIVKELYNTEKEFAWGDYPIFSKWDDGIFSAGRKSRCFRAAEIEVTDDFWNEWNEHNPGEADVLDSVSGQNALFAYSQDKVPGQQYTYHSKLGSDSWDQFPNDIEKGKKYVIIFQSVFDTGITVGLKGTWNLLTSGDMGEWYYETDFIITEELKEKNYCQGWA